MADRLAARFWNKVDKSGDCWLWLSAMRGDTGYGEFWLNRRSFQAHRVSYQLTHNVQLDSSQLVLRDHNAALNILDKALGTVGHTGTSKSASLQNASGDRTSPTSSKRRRGKSDR